MEKNDTRFSIQFSRSLLGKIDEMKEEWGLKSRGATVERLLQELFAEEIKGDEPSKAEE